MTKQDAIIARYKEAYARHFPGKYLSLEHWQGWYTLYTGGMTQSKYRGRDIEAMTDRLWQRPIQDPTQ